MKFNQYDYQQTQERKILESVSVAALVQVSEFDPIKMTVDVIPTSKHLENGEYQSQPPVLAIPVAITRSGGYIVRPWINPGDIGLVVYSDHDIDNAIEKGQETEPATERNHSATDAIYIGGIVAGDYTAPANIPSESFVIAKEDGDAFFAVSQDNITLQKGKTALVITDDGISMAGSNLALGSSGPVSIAGTDVTVTGVTVNIN